MDENEVKARSRRGTWWTMAGQAGGLVLLLATEVIRGRFFTPVQLGVFTAALVLTGLVAYLGEFGLGAEIVRRRDLTGAQISAAHRAMVYASWGLGAACFAASPLLGWWYGDWSVVPVAQVLAWSFVLQGPGMIAKALLQRELAFAAIVQADLASTAVRLGLLVLLAWLGLDVWALVLALMSGFLCQTVLYRLRSGWRPEPPDWSVFRELLGEGSRITGSRVLFYVQENVDRLLLGRAGDAAALGIYGRGVTLAALPMARITAVFNQVAFPAFAALVADPPALRRHYLTTLRDISLLSMPAGVGLALVAREAVLAVYGEAWLDAVPIVQAVAVVSIFRSLRVVAPAVFVARGQSRFNLVLSAASAIIHGVAFAVGSQWGLTGMALAYLVGVAPLNVLILLISARAVGVRLGSILASVAPSAVCAAAMGAAVAATLMLLPETVADWPDFAWALARLLLGTTVGLGSYGSLTWVSSPFARGALRRVVRRVRGRSG